MDLARFWVRSELRRRWPAWLVTSLAVGLIAGGVLAALAGARRTDSAYDRFQEANRSFHVAAGVDCSPAQDDSAPEQEDRDPGLGFSAPTASCLDEIRALPAVEDLTTLDQYGAQLFVDGRTAQPTDDPCYSDAGVVVLVADPSGRFGHSLGRYDVAEGRLPDPRRADEVAVAQETARRLDLHPGDVLEASLVSSDSCQAAPSSWPAPRRFTVVGTTVGAFEVRPSSGHFINAVLATPAFAAAAPTVAIEGTAALIRLDDGADGLEDLWSEARAAGIGLRVELNGATYTDDLARAVRPSSQALRLLGGLAAAAGLVVLVPVLVRHVAVGASDLAVLSALGATRQWRLAAVAALAVPVGGAATAVAGAVAVIGSHWTPVGVARAVEPDPGMAVDGLVLGVGLVLLTVVVATTLAAAAWRSSGAAAASEGGPTRRARLRRALLRTGPPTLVAGLRMALGDVSRRAALPARSGLVAVVLGVTTLTAALTFGAGLHRLVTTPRLVGVNWDHIVFYPSLPAPADEDGVPIPLADVTAALANEEDVDAFAIGTIFPPFDERAVQVGPPRTDVGLVSFSGAVGPAVVEGRAPRRAEEILLSPTTADDLDVDVGDTVQAHGRTGGWEEPGDFEETSQTMEVVGTGVLPFGGGGGLGRGASVTLDGLRLLAPDAAEPGVVYLDLAEGAELDVVVPRLVDALGLPPLDDARAVDVGGEGIPLLDVRHVDALPWLLGGLMAAMASAVLGHLLVSGVRRHRRDLSVLRALGFSPSQVRKVVAWQATTLAGAAVVVGVPVGIAAGRSMWLSFSARLGAVPEAAVPAALLLVVPGVLLLANVAAAAPGRTAARRSPADGLRTE